MSDYTPENTNSIFPTKNCTHCGVEKLATAEYFCADKRKSNGLSSWCRSCVNQQIRERYANDTEYRERQKQQHKDKRVNDPNYREKNNKRQKEKRANDIEYHKRERQWHNQRHKERCVSDPEYRERITQRQNKRQKERYANDPTFREKTKQLTKATRHKRRSAEGTYTTTDEHIQYRSQRGKCWHCGKELNGVYHIDHLIPLDKGGTNWPNNIVCSCKHCNLSKGAKYTYEWNGRLF